MQDLVGQNTDGRRMRSREIILILLLVNIFTLVTLRQALYYKRNIEASSCNNFCRGKAISNTYSECMFVALIIQHAMRMRHIFVCGLSGSNNFSTLFHICYDFRKNVLKIKFI
jgi:hypothetical protein